MSLNQPLAADGYPQKLQNEHFLLERKDIEFEVKIDKFGRLSGKGRLLITTLRLILINDKGKKTDKIKTFDLPLILIFKEKLKMPLFGANYFTGTCKPFPPASLPSDPVFKIWYNRGTITAFLKCLRYCLKLLRDNIDNDTYSLNDAVITKKFQ